MKGIFDRSQKAEEKEVNQAYMVQVNNVPIEATFHDVASFFSFCGPIEKVLLRRDKAWSQVAYIAFINPESVDTATLFSGSAFLDHRVSILRMDDSDQEAVFKYASLQPVVQHTSSTTPWKVATKAYMAKYS